MQWLKNKQGALKLGSITRVGTMAQKLVKRKRWSSRPHGSRARDREAISLESVTQSASSSCVLSHRQKPNPPGIQPSAVRLHPKPSEVLSHKRLHAIWQSPLGTFSPAKGTKKEKTQQNKNQQTPKTTQQPPNKILNFS